VQGSTIRSPISAVRGFPTRFIIRIGHDSAELERVVEKAPGYAVVEKTGTGAVAAVRFDPRRQPWTNQDGERVRELIMISASTQLRWKFEDGPEDSEDDHDPNDVGPAWIERPDGSEEPVNGFDSITRHDARSLSEESGYRIHEDG
jgi:hypothetical protein